MMSIPKLIDAMCSAWSKCLPPPYGSGEYAPSNGETHCNQFIIDICNQFGYLKFNGLNANHIFDALSINDDWMEIGGDIAQFHANNGALVIAAWKNPTGDHGHVCLVRPGTAEPSQSWHVLNDSVPKVANVSNLNLCRLDRKASFAFSLERLPKYFVKKDMVP